MAIRSMMCGICAIAIILLQTVGAIPYEMSLNVGAVTLDEREISVTTTKNVYAPGEFVDIIITNTGATRVAGFIFVDFYHVTDFYDLVFWLRPGDLPDLYELDVGETYTYLWAQNDNNNLQVADGSYAVKVRFLECCGPIATDWIYFTIQSVAVESIAGGKGISMHIKNIGTEIACNITWSVDISKTYGFVLTNPHAEGEISSIAVGASELVNINPIIGFGKAEIHISVESSKQIIRCLLFGPVVFIES